MANPAMVEGVADSLLLTVIVPVFNEERTVHELLRRLLAALAEYPDKEVIVVDDGSTDGTLQQLQSWARHPAIAIVRHPENRGKGAAIRTALARARGTITVIQDADLEYNPTDLPRLVEILRGGVREVVYGSRYLRRDRKLPQTWNRLAVQGLNLLVWLLYGQRLTDEATCYKAFRTALLRRLNLQATGFEFCPEVTAKVCRLGYAIREVPITYRPRTVAEGKKIRCRDAWRAVWTLLQYRFASMEKAARHAPRRRPIGPTAAATRSAHRNFFRFSLTGGRKTATDG